MEVWERLQYRILSQRVLSWQVENKRFLRPPTFLLQDHGFGLFPELLGEWIISVNYLGAQKAQSFIRLLKEEM